MCNTGGLLGCTANDPFQTVIRARGAYHLRSTHPVTVYQFSPLDYTDGAGLYTYTNDASLLLPSNALRENYVVSAWQHWPQFNYPGMLAVTATADNTDITITTKAPVDGTPGFQTDVPETVTLQRGDVIQLVNLSGDLTGSSVSASKPPVAPRPVPTGTRPPTSARPPGARTPGRQSSTRPAAGRSS